jgi:hypothetical protein
MSSDTPTGAAPQQSLIISLMLVDLFIGIVFKDFEYHPWDVVAECGVL